MTKKQIHLSRSDLVKYNLFVLPRIPSYLRTLMIFWAIIFFFDWSANHELPEYTLGAARVLSALIFAFGAFVLWYAAVLTFVMLGAKHNGLVGDTVYSIEDDGFRYVTESTDSLTRWGSIGKSEIIGKMIYVELSSYIFCLLPRHQFDNDEEFNSFLDEIRSRLQSAGQ